MRGFGALLVVAAGVLGGLCWCRENRRHLAVALRFRREMLLMERWIHTERRPVTELAALLAGQEGETAAFWQTLQEELYHREEADRCWNTALERLDGPCRGIFADQGAALLTGDETARRLLQSLLGELEQHLERERKTGREKEKMALALGFSAGAMGALALL